MVLVNLWYNVYNVAGVPIYMFYAFCSSDWVNIMQISGNVAQAHTSRKGSRVLTSVSGVLKDARECLVSNAGCSREGGLSWPARTTPESQERFRGNSFFPDVESCTLGGSEGSL